ncbi:hypothetical protein Tco_0821973 [Tanacetum coccineum]|uniref:Uncharacterized protein n=1 Tax=Tanacetum coccineum TaxID=301880 RepID=A0ABQ5AIL9_9ASTR
MDTVPARLVDIVEYLQPIATQRSAESIIGRLLLAASSYIIWIERNNRTFKQVKRTPEDIRDTLMVTVSSKGRKIPEFPWGSPIPIGDGDGDVKRFPDGDGDGDGDEAHKRGWGW